MTNQVLIPLESVNAKLHHAETYLNSVKDEVRSWMDQNPYSIPHQTNADFTRYSLILRINKEPPLVKWSLAIGDIIHNLRCALDHLIYAIAIHESGQDPPPNADKLMFPICDDSAKFRDQSKRRLNTLSLPIRTAIEAVQPYNRPHSALPPLLAILRDFNDIDKHRLLRLAFSAVARGNIGFCGPHLTKGCHFVANAGELKDGAEVAAFVFDSPGPDMKFDRIDFILMLALWRIKPQHNTSPFDERIDFTAMLRLLLNEVKEVIDKVLKIATPKEVEKYNRVRDGN